MTSYTENMTTRRLLLSSVFFLLALNAIALIYMLVDSKGIFSRMASARIARMADAPEAREAQDQDPNQDQDRSPSPDPARSAPASEPAASPPGPALTMAPATAIAATGACIAVDNFKSDLQAKSARALLASSPLRDKSWTVSTPVPATYLAGVQTDSAASARKISKTLSDMGLAPLSMSSNFVGLARADSATSASELAALSASGLPGSKIVTRQISPPSDRHALVILPQSRLETQFAASLTSRLPGVSLSAVPCPEAASALLAAK